MVKIKLLSKCADHCPFLSNMNNFEARYSKNHVGLFLLLQNFLYYFDMYK